MRINLNNIEDVKKFISISQNITGPIVLESGIYRVDAKSVLGIFSLDLSKPVTLKLNEDEYFKFKGFEAK